MQMIARQLLRQALFILALAAGGLVGAACGGSPPSGVANLGSTTTTAQTSSSQTAGSGASTAAKYEAVLTYVDCIRSNGVSNFPDPTNAGVVHLIGVDQNSPQYQSTQKTCEALVPGADSK